MCCRRQAAARPFCRCRLALLLSSCPDILPLPPCAAAKLLPPSCCHQTAAVKLLPGHSATATKLLPPICCRQVAATKLLPPSCCPAILPLPPCAAAKLLPPCAAAKLLPPICCHQVAAAKLLPPSCCRQVAAAKLPAGRSLRRLSGFGSLSLCKSVVELLYRDAILLESLGDAAVGEQ